MSKSHTRAGKHSETSQRITLIGTIFTSSFLQAIRQTFSAATHGVLLSQGHETLEFLNQGYTAGAIHSAGKVTKQVK